MITSAILVGLIAALVAGSSGYLISFRFNRSDYAAKDRSGDFGAPRGGFITLLAGALIGMVFFNLMSHTSVFAPALIGVGMMVSMIVGAAAGVVGMIRGQNSRKNKS